VDFCQYLGRGKSQGSPGKMGSTGKKVRGGPQESFAKNWYYPGLFGTFYPIVFGNFYPVVFGNVYPDDPDRYRPRRSSLGGPQQPKIILAAPGKPPGRLGRASRPVLLRSPSEAWTWTITHAA
jgi:hypothetical protein